MTIRTWVGKSRIAGKGLFTLQEIKQGTRIMQYVGDRISKAESAKRLAQGNVSIFTFSAQYDIDGNVLRNTARYINHSCHPNCEAELTRRCIWIVALRDIQAGEELSYNYGYPAEAYQEWPCTCGAANCFGYILDQKLWGLFNK